MNEQNKKDKGAQDRERNWEKDWDQEKDVRSSDDTEGVEGMSDKE